MAKKHVYSKDTHGFGDFVYVDLLPELKRSRQFNVNVIIALLYAIVLGFFLVYRPYSAAIFELEDKNSDNYDLQHELLLTQEEFEGYEIDVSAITFEQDIVSANQLRIDFNNLLDDLELRIDQNDGQFESISYDAESAMILLTVGFNDQYRYNTLNTDILGINWVATSNYLIPTDGSNVYTYEIGVDYNVE